MYDEVTMRIVSAALLVVLGLGAGWQATADSRRRVKAEEPSQGSAWKDPTGPLTRMRDVLLALSLVLVLAMVVSPRLLLNSIFELSFPLDSLVQTLGLGVIVYGLVLGAWALNALGEFATTRISLMKNHRLIQSGPYRFVRHPLYGSTLLLGLGLFLLYLNLLFLALSLPIFAINTYRAQIEEKLLASPLAFGSQYQEYRGRTRRFIPYLI